MITNCKYLWKFYSKALNQRRAERCVPTPLSKLRFFFCLKKKAWKPLEMIVIVITCFTLISVFERSAFLKTSSSVPKLFSTKIKTRMTTSTSSVIQKKLSMETQTKSIIEQMANDQKSRNLSPIWYILCILFNFIFCSMTDRPTDQAN